MLRFTPIARYGRDGTTGAESLFSGGNALHLLPAPSQKAAVDRAMLGGLTIGRVASTGHEVALSEPLNWSLVMPLAGTIETEVNGRTLRARPGQGLLLEPGPRRTRVVPAKRGESFRGVPILLPAIAGAPGHAQGRILDAARSRQDAQALRLARLLYDEASGGTGLLDRPTVADSWTGLLSEILGDALRDAPPACVADGAAAGRVRKAEAFMHAHLGDIATIRDIAQAQGQSVRSLEVAFRSIRGVSPGRYLAELRLQAARALLLAEDGPASVTEVCLTCGIGHQGRFAAAYRARFGEPPSETLRRR
jgi:AraC-like DNA-binding protein